MLRDMFKKTYTRIDTKYREPERTVTADGEEPTIPPVSYTHLTLPTTPYV